MSYATVNYERRGKIAYITLNRPESLNAVNDQLEGDLIAAFQEFDADAEAWVAILHGAGRCFSAGADVKQRFLGGNQEERLRRTELGRSPEGYLGRAVNWKPVIAAVHSYCLGSGISIALECDLIVATQDAHFALTETKRGLPGGRVWAKLQFFMPSKVASELLLTGEPMPASEFYRLGLINRLVPEGQHLQAAEELAQKILQAPPLAVRSGVRVSRWPWVRLVAEADMYIQPLRLHTTDDFQESARAFVEKREPLYRGR
ncbi:MAG: enoyl-CoA hydratase/isomerase family protein [Dehalococcoidia bacterium]